MKMEKPNETKPKDVEDENKTSKEVTGNNSNAKEGENSNASLIDSFYKFDEPAPEKVDGELYYTPSYFLRTHSKNNNPADVQTQVNFKFY